MSDVDEFFPGSPRVIYSNSPLREVVCELRFPPILKIDNPSPAEFQERIRGQFPFFEKQVALPPGMQVPPEIANLIAAQNQAVYRFRTESGASFISLMNNTVSLTTHAYQRWEAFQRDARTMLETFVELYRPAFFIRIGLRYQNVILPQGGLSEWRSILSDNIVGEFRAAQPSTIRITEAQRATRFASDSGEGVLLQHGIGRLQDQTTDAYIIDIDCYTDAKTGANDALPILSRLNSRAGRAFRWCISDKLHAALQPKNLDSNLTP